jgi:hypothetical protein
MADNTCPTYDTHDRLTKDEIVDAAKTDMAGKIRAFNQAFGGEGKP